MHETVQPTYEIAQAVVQEYGSIDQAAASSRFLDVEPGISVRDSMNRRSKDFFRWDERTPRWKNEKIAKCDEAYRHCGPVHSIIDMMTDFVCQGLEVYHPTESRQSTIRHWWKRVGGYNLSWQVVNHALRHGGVGVLRTFSKLDASQIKDLETTFASDDIPYRASPSSIQGRIPLQYNVLNPLTISILGGALGQFAGVQRYGVEINQTLASTIRNPKTAIEKEIVKGLPPVVVEAAKSKDRVVPLDPERIEVLFYKKDDYEAWPDPITLPVYDDVVLYNKMKLADNAALDGALSRVRVWNVGHIDKDIRIPPTAEEMAKLKKAVMASQAGGSIDIFWGPFLTFTESSTDVYKFLGQAKYEPSLQAIYAGLGVPQSATGGSAAGGMTTTALSLKTLIERLHYARTMLVRFWDGEFEKIRKAFGHQKPGELQFSIMSFADEAAEKMLWIQLYDRHLISDETIQERFGEMPEIEIARMRRESAQRQSGRRQPRQGAFTEMAGHPDQLKKASLNLGLTAPSQVGVNLDEKKPGDKSVLDRQDEQAVKTAKIAAKNQQNPDKNGVAGEGRPRGSKDGGNRKRRTPKSTKASTFALQAEARGILREVADAVVPAYLESVGKKNLRSLSTAESERLELVKFAHLMRAEGSGPIAVDLDASPQPSHLDTLNELAADAFASRGVNPTVEDRRELQIAAWALAREENHGQA